MPNYLHRASKQLLRSVSGPTYLAEPVANYIKSPDLSSVAGFDSKYWVVTGDVISLMSQAERDVVDAAADVTRLDSIADELERTQTLLRAFAEVVLDDTNGLRAQHGQPARTLRQLRNAVRGKL